MIFQNRREAGQALGERLLKWRDRGDVVVLGIPRGGVIVAAQVAQALRAPLDVFLTHKIGAPDNPELAIGAVASDGTTILDQDIIRDLDVPPEYVEQERQAQLREIERRLAVYRQGRPAVPVAGAVRDRVRRRHRHRLDGAGGVAGVAGATACRR